MTDAFKGEFEYDEFGNYVGGELSDESEFEESEESEESLVGAGKALDALSDKMESLSVSEKDSMAPMSEVPSSLPIREQLEVAEITGEHRSAAVLHSDKSYYLSAEDTYGSGVETVFHMEDTQPLETPIIAPLAHRCFQRIETELPKTTFDFKYLAGLMDTPALVRNVAVIGQLHHGKTSLLDILVKETHAVGHWLRKGKAKELRYSDVRLDEATRGLSLKCSPLSLVLQTLAGKSFVVNVIDTPGHSQFVDEVSCALRIADGALLVVDAVEGVLQHTEQLLRHCLRSAVPMSLCINKIDRLILELKLPPRDAYLKLLHTVSEVNRLVLKHLAAAKRDYFEVESEEAHCGDDPSVGGHFKQRLLTPNRGNVCFASAKFGFVFTLQSFAKIYADYHYSTAAPSGLLPPTKGGKRDSSKELHAEEFYRKLASKLWGNHYLDSSTRRIVKKAKSGSEKRTFVEFILEPVYKVFSQVLGANSYTDGDLRPLLTELGLFPTRIKKRELKLDTEPLLTIILQRFFGHSNGLTEMLVTNVPSPIDAAYAKVARNYCGDLQRSSAMADGLLQCDARSAHCFVNVVKMFPRADASQFDAFGRVFSGTLRKGDKVTVMREGYAARDSEDLSRDIRVEAIWVYNGRYRVEVNRVSAGNWALFGGSALDKAIAKTATLYKGPPATGGTLQMFAPIDLASVSVCKVAIEPLKPSELPKMTRGLRCVNKSFPLLRVRVEESGEHTIIGTGELYLDVALKELRQEYAETELRVSDPCVCLTETCEERSTIHVFSHTLNMKNRLSAVCEPLGDELTECIEAKRRSLAQWSAAKTGAFFEERFSWDKLASRNIWAFGPQWEVATQSAHCNVLLNECLAADGVVDKTLGRVQPAIVSGFLWATRCGPLCDEPLRGCKVRLTEARLSPSPMQSSQGQIIPCVRRLIYSSLLLAKPKIVEPYLSAEVLCAPDCVDACDTVLRRRRGVLLAERKKAGTPLTVLYASLPAMDSFGFETDIRCHSSGQASVTRMAFDKWQPLSADPMDESIVLRPLEPQPIDALAREFMLKTRRRKGLNDAVTYHKYFDTHNSQMSDAFAEHLQRFYQ